jgi:F0F1-type ATP synthase beta subunit
VKFSLVVKEGSSVLTTQLLDSDVIIVFMEALLDGEGDEYPEAAFYMMGTLEESFEEGKRLAQI